MVRHKHSEKRLTKGYSKMDPRKLQKLEQGLRRCEVYDDPPDSVNKFYSKGKVVFSVHEMIVLTISTIQNIDTRSSQSYIYSLFHGTLFLLFFINTCSRKFCFGYP